MTGAIAFLSIAIVATAPPVRAQCSAPADTNRALAASVTAFVGEAVETSDFGRVAQLRVTSIWKGRDLPAHVEVRGAAELGAEPSASDRHFEVGTSYLVIPENSREPFLASACSATQPTTAVGNLIPQSYQDAVGATEGRSPTGGVANSNTSRVNFPIIPVIVAVTAVILVSLLYLKIRNGMPSRVESFKKEPPVKKPRAKRLKKRSLKADRNRVGDGKKLVQKNRRTWKHRRRRQERQLAAAASETAKGSTDTS